MPMFLDTSGNATLAIGICDRCKRKFPLGELSPDRNSPGLRVCKDDNDVFDPWRLPARKTENIALDNPRTEDDIPTTASWTVDTSVEPAEVVTAPIPTNTAVVPSSN